MPLRYFGHTVVTVTISSRNRQKMHANDEGKQRDTKPVEGS